MSEQELGCLLTRPHFTPFHSAYHIFMPFPTIPKYAVAQKRAAKMLRSICSWIPTICIYLTSPRLDPDFPPRMQRDNQSVKAEPTPCHLINLQWKVQPAGRAALLFFWQTLFIPVEELTGKSNFSQILISHEETEREREEVSVKAKHQITLNYDCLVRVKLH